MSVRNCKRIYVKLTTDGDYITIWQPVFGGANGLETVVQTGLTSKTFMDGLTITEDEAVVQEGVSTYVKTSVDDVTVTNGTLTAGAVITEAPFVGWRLLADAEDNPGFTTASPLIVGGGEGV